MCHYKLIVLSRFLLRGCKSKLENEQQVIVRDSNGMNILFLFISFVSILWTSLSGWILIQWNPETPPKKVQIFEKSGGVGEITMFCWQTETRFGLHYPVVREMGTFLYNEIGLMFLEEYRLENLIVFFLTWMCVPVDIWCLSKTRWKQYIKRHVTCNQRTQILIFFLVWLFQSFFVQTYINSNI